MPGDESDSGSDSDSDPEPGTCGPAPLIAPAAALQEGARRDAPYGRPGADLARSNPLPTRCCLCNRRSCQSHRKHLLTPPMGPPALVGPSPGCKQPARCCLCNRRSCQSRSNPLRARCFLRPKMECRWLCAGPGGGGPGGGRRLCSGAVAACQGASISIRIWLGIRIRIRIGARRQARERSPGLASPCTF